MNISKIDSMMNNASCYVFQTDSEIVRQVYEKQDNYLIEYDETGRKEWCAIYFCSNDIYYPNTEEIFRKRIIEKNFFEWYHSRIKKASKHIFVRDIFKQWYLAGINTKIDTPEKLTAFLREETKGYHIVTIGSSAGGYAAALYGSLLNADYALTFNPQFEIESLLSRSTERINPLLFRLRANNSIGGGGVKYYNINSSVKAAAQIFYFYSNGSKWDMEQCRHVGYSPNLYKIAFRTSHHGIPFLKIALPTVINWDVEKLKGLSGKEHSPIGFTMKAVGVVKTIRGLCTQLYQAYKKRR